MRPSERMLACEDAILKRGGSIADPWDYAASVSARDKHDPAALVAALDGYLKATGVEHFTGLEVCAPSSSSQRLIKNATDGPKGHKSEVRGKYVLLPPVWMWLPIACVVKCAADPIRKAYGASVTLRNGLRPWWLNQQVAGSGVASDHPHTAALDLDLTGSGGDVLEAHRAAQTFYVGEATSLEVSMGRGPKTIHVAIFSPHGHRKEWTYGDGPPRT